MAPQEIFGAQEHLDRTEGKGGARVVGWFATKAEAQRFSNELPGVFGARNSLPVIASMLYETANEHPDFNEAEAARRSSRIRELEAELKELRSQGPQ